MCKAPVAEVGKSKETGWITVDQSCAASSVGVEVVGSQSREETDVSCKGADAVDMNGVVRRVDGRFLCDCARSLSLVILYCFSR